MNKKNDAIGGYYGLEPSGRKLFHPSATKFNTFRSGLEAYLMTLQDGSTIHIPVFLCPSVHQTIFRVSTAKKLTTIPYDIDEKLRPVLNNREPGDYIYHYDVFGLSGAISGGHVIADYTHSFFRPPKENQITLYSLRKFFGVPDGSYLLGPHRLLQPQPWNLPVNEIEFLFTRPNLGAEAGFLSYQNWERYLDLAPIAGMSALSESIIGAVDFSRVKKSRLENFIQIHQGLRKNNSLSKLIDTALNLTEFVPFCYPYMTSNAQALKQKLIKSRVFVPTLWSGINSPQISPFVQDLIHDVVHIPVDQRYSQSDMHQILEMI